VLDPASIETRHETSLDQNPDSRQELGELILEARHPVLGLVVAPVFNRRLDPCECIDPGIRVGAREP
jgi:hypothetical protein